MPPGLCYGRVMRKGDQPLSLNHLFAFQAMTLFQSLRQLFVPAKSTAVTETEVSAPAPAPVEEPIDPQDCFKAQAVAFGYAYGFLTGVFHKNTNRYWPELTTNNAQRLVDMYNNLPNGEAQELVFEAICECDDYYTAKFMANGEVDSLQHECGME